MPAALLALVLAASPALAVEGVPLDPPLPVAGVPWTATATAWDLPPQRTDYLVEEVEELRCTVALVVQPDGAHQPAVGQCPDTMTAEALAAAGRWRFAPTEADAPTHAAVTFVLRYSAALGAMTLHAEVDPGVEAAASGLEGRPGLKLVHEAAPLKPLVRKLPGKLARAGLGDTACRFRVRVGTAGRALETLLLECPEALAADAEQRVARARYSPTRVDGLRQEDVVEVELTYQR